MVFVAGKGYAVADRRRWWVRIKMPTAAPPPLPPPAWLLKNVMVSCCYKDLVLFCQGGREVGFDWGGTRCAIWLDALWRDLCFSWQR